MKPGIHFRAGANQYGARKYRVLHSNGYVSESLGTITRRTYDIPVASVGWRLELNNRKGRVFDTLADAKDAVHNEVAKALDKVFGVTS